MYYRSHDFTVTNTLVNDRHFGLALNNSYVVWCNHTVCKECITRADEHKVCKQWKWRRRDTLDNKTNVKVHAGWIFLKQRHNNTSIICLWHAQLRLGKYETQTSQLLSPLEKYETQTTFISRYYLPGAVITILSYFKSI